MQSGADGGQGNKCKGEGVLGIGNSGSRGWGWELWKGSGRGVEGEWREEDRENERGC